MIDSTRDLVIAKYTTANGYKANADVIYGDTDSIMINTNSNNLQEVIHKEYRINGIVYGIVILVEKTYSESRKRQIFQKN